MLYKPLTTPARPQLLHNFLSCAKLSHPPLAVPRCHLKAAGLALGVITLLLLGALILSSQLEARYLYRITPELGLGRGLSGDHVALLQHLERVKNQGSVLQRQAFRHGDLLPLYGSSELMKPIADKASLFFAHFPTGFEVFPVGKAGSTSLIELQKITAAKPPRGSKVALSLSPSWFIHSPEPHAYEGNFSSSQATALAFSPRLSFELKRALAQRLLQFPSTAERRPFLHFTLAHLARSSVIDRALYYTTVPLGVLQHWVNDAQEHLEISFYLLKQRRSWDPKPDRQERSIDWQQQIAAATRQSDSAPPRKVVSSSDRHRLSDDAFLDALSTSPEWNDLELMLRVLRELHLKPLLLSMPLPGQTLAAEGLSVPALQAYAKRLDDLARKYKVPLDAFEDHLVDSAFLADNHDHLSAKGWMYYNQSLDRFYHASSKKLLYAKRHTRHNGA